MIGLLPGFIDSVALIDRTERLYRVRIPGLTDGATVQPRAEILNALGDKSEHTEVRIKPGDKVWLAFEGGDTRYPVIVGYRATREENAIDWRRFEQANFQFNADNVFEIIAGTQVHVKTPLAFVEADESHLSGNAKIDGNLTVDGLLTFNGGMTGKGGKGGGPAMIVSGGAAFSDDVTAAGTSVHGHGHIEQGDGNRVSNPVA